MNSECSTESRISFLDAEIAQTLQRIRQIQRSRLPFQRDVTSARRQLWLLQTVRRIRGPASSYQLWKIGCVLVGAATAFGASFIAADLLEAVSKPPHHHDEAGELNKTVE
jgi:hypothetical protein